MRVLIIGELGGHATSAAQIAIKKGGKVSSVNTIEEAIENLRSGKGADIVLADLMLDIPSLIKSLEVERISVPVVACGISSNPKRTVEAIRAGAKEYIPLPPDPDLIAAVLSAVSYQDTSFICHDPKMVDLLKMTDRVAPSEASILITGESGTGKEVLAHYVHKKSRRSSRPFISLNCAAIPDNLLESELFGHEKGAFTGALARRIGKFEEANGGTLFLDEITEMHPRLQAKLLRAIQERIIDRVGGTTPVPVDIRIIATSNRNLLEAVKNNDFREDLYFRLNVVNLNLHSLRERTKDILPLATYFSEKYAQLNGLPIKKISESCKKSLLSYKWPGNVRELENTMHRAVLMSQLEEIITEDVFTSAQEKASRQENLEDKNDFIGKKIVEVEQAVILETLSHCLGNRTHAANILGISIRTLRNKLKEYSEMGINIPTSALKG